MLGIGEYCTSTTATQAKIPKITPQLSMSHFSTVNIQPWRREQEKTEHFVETGGCRRDEWLRDSIRTWTRALSQHHGWLWTESVRGRITQLDWAEENGGETSEQNRGAFRVFDRITPQLSVFTVLRKCTHSATVSWKLELHNKSNWRNEEMKVQVLSEQSRRVKFTSCPL